MNKKKAISHIAKYHLELVKFVQKNAINEKQFRSAEDFVQNFYLKLLESNSFDVNKFYTIPNVINKSYVLKVLKNMIIDDVRKKKIKVVKIEKVKHIIPSKSNNKRKEILFSKMKEAINTLEGFDKRLLNIYTYHIPSIRKMSKEININTKKINKSLIKSKEILKIELAQYSYNL